MQQLETYSLLLSDTFFTNLAIDNSTELVIHTIKIFGNYQPLPVIAIATIGFVLASMANYLLGKVIFKIVAPSEEGKYQEMQNRMTTIRNFKFLPLIILFSAVPFWGKFVVLFAGFCNIRFIYTMSILTVAKLSYYSYLILLT